MTFAPRQALKRRSFPSAGSAARWGDPALADFNGDMTTAYRVTGTLETPVSMEEGNAEITGWEPVDGGDVDAGM